MLHIEGRPDDRGPQQGWLLAKEIKSYIATLSEYRAAKESAEYWALYRQLVSAGVMYLHRSTSNTGRK